MDCTFTIRNRWYGYLLVSAFLAQPAWAVPPSDTLLPDTTCGYLSVADVQALSSSWDKTQIGQLMQDPVMKPFSEDLQAQLRSRWTRIQEKLGLTLDDLKGVPGGEVAIAVIQPQADQAAMAVVVDVTDHLTETQALLEKIHTNLTRQGAKVSESEVQGTRLTTYRLPDVEKRRPNRQAIFFLKDNVLVGTDHAATAQAILGRFSEKPAHNLAGVAAYQKVMARAEKNAQGLKPEIRWFMNPFRYFETMRIANPERAQKRRKDLLRVFGSQGFDAVLGLGGYVNFSVRDRYEMIHQTAIYAPPVADAAPGERYHLAARMLNFPNTSSEKLSPPAWVPRDLATCVGFQVDTAKAFEASSTLVDALVGEKGVFEDTLRSLQEDPNGPQINLRDHLVAYLGRQATLISDYHLPITPQAERIVFAVETHHEAELQDTINRTMATDPDARRRDFNGHVIWEILNAENDLPQVHLETPNFDPVGRRHRPEEDHKRGLPNSAVCVAYGQMLIATHVDFLMKVLTPLSERETLSHCLDYELVSRELDTLLPGENSVRVFSRTDEEYRSTYELIRAGRMPEAKSVFGRLLNAVLGADLEEGELRAQKIDGHNLPDFEMVRRYFGPAGTKVVSEPEGWFVLGVTLSKDVE